MKIDFKQGIFGPNGNFARDGEGKVVTLQAVCVFALLQDDQIDAPEKLKRYNLANKVNFSVGRDGFEGHPILKEDADFTVQELALIESLIGKYQSTWVYGVVHDIFNSPPSEAAKEGDDTSIEVLNMNVPSQMRKVERLLGEEPNWDAVEEQRLKMKGSEVLKQVGKK